MKKTNVPAIDGIPGIMPGILTLSDVDFENEEPKSTPKCDENYRVQRVANISRHKIRMMPCNKEGKRFKSFKGRIWNSGSVFPLAFYLKNNNTLISL